MFGYVAVIRCLSLAGEPTEDADVNDDDDDDDDDEDEDDEDGDEDGDEEADGDDGSDEDAALDDADEESDGENGEELLAEHDTLTTCMQIPALEQAMRVVKEPAPLLRHISVLVDKIYLRERAQMLQTCIRFYALAHMKGVDMKMAFHHKDSEGASEYDSNSVNTSEPIHHLGQWDMFHLYCVLDKLTISLVIKAFILSG